MLSPEYLRLIPNDLVAIFEDIEDEILKDIARRIKKTGYLTATAERQAEVLISSPHDLRSLKNSLKPYLNEADEVIDRLIDESSLKHYESEEKAYRQVQKKLGLYKDNDNILKRVEVAKERLKSDINNLTNTIGMPIGDNSVTLDKIYKSELNKATFMIQSGAFDSVSTARKVINKLSNEGMKFINYENSGRNYNLDSAVRSILRTTLNQLTGEISLKNAEDMEQDLMEITAHMGARPSHAEWQGQIVSLSGADGYLSLSDIGYGDVSGFMGANCRHNWYPFFEGLSKRNYTAEELRNIDPEPFEFNGKEYTYYEATQKQRQIERSIRNNKRKIVMYSEIEDKEALIIASVRMQRQRQLYKDFLTVGNLKGRSDYLSATGYNRSMASGVYWTGKKAKEDKFLVDIINKKWTDKFKKKAIKTYNDFKKQGYIMDSHFIGRFEQRKVYKSFQEITNADIIKQIDLGHNYTQDGRHVYFNVEKAFAFIQNPSNKEFISFIRRKTVKKDWDKL